MNNWSNASAKVVEREQPVAERVHHRAQGVRQILSWFFNEIEKNSKHINFNFKQPHAEF